MSNALVREFVVSEAPLDRVAALARATVEELGGVVAHHSERTTEFDHLRDDEGDWSRSGYIGTYQRYKEEPVRLRIRVWASWPRKLFYWTVWLGLIEAVVFFSMSLVQAPPSPNVWILTAILTFALLGATFLMYSTSWADSADLEDRLARRLTNELLDDEAIEGDIYTLGEWEEHRAEVIDQAVETAKRQAPERPSKAKQLARSIGSTGGASELVQRFRSSEDDEDEEQAPEETDETAPEEEQAAAAERRDEEEQETPEHDEEDEDGLLDRVAFWRSTEDDDEQADEAADAEPEDDLEAKRKRLEELKQQRGEEARAEDEDDDEGGLVDRLAFWRSTGDEDEADDEGPDREPGSTHDAGAEEDEAPEDEPDPHEGDAHAQEDEPPDLSEADTGSDEDGDEAGKAG